MAPLDLLFENGLGYNTKSSINLYSMPWIIVFKIQNNPATTTSVITWKPFCLRQITRYNIIWPQIFCSRIIIRPAKQLITQKNHPLAFLKVYVDHCKLSWECTYSARFTIVPRWPGGPSSCQLFFLRWIFAFVVQF